MIVGFTGTRRGMTPEQYAAVEHLVAGLCPSEAHHGGCVGSDVQFHRIARQEGVGRLVGHPPKNPKFRAWCDFDDLWAEKGYYERDRDIVDVSGVLIAAPKERLALTDWRAGRGGTWYTIRYALNRVGWLYVVWPDGDYMAVSRGQPALFPGR